jgi:hypothetical protein
MGATRSSQAPWHWPRGAESAQSLLRGEARPLPLAGAFHPRRPSWGRCVLPEDRLGCASFVHRSHEL